MACISGRGPQFDGGWYQQLHERISGAGAVDWRDLRPQEGSPDAEDPLFMAAIRQVQAANPAERKVVKMDQFLRLFLFSPYTNVVPRIADSRE